MQVTSATLLPVLVSAAEARSDTERVLDWFAPGLALGYSFGPPYGEQFVKWGDLERLRMSRRTVRRQAEENLYDSMQRVRILGQPPALLLAFEGLESAVLVVDEFWNDLQRAVPGDLVIGVPARDVVIITGSESAVGMDRIRRAVARVVETGGPNLLLPHLLAWRRGAWEPLPTPEPLPQAPQIALPSAGPAPHTPVPSDQLL